MTFCQKPVCLCFTYSVYIGKKVLNIFIDCLDYSTEYALTEQVKSQGFFRLLKKNLEANKKIGQEESIS